MEILAHSRLLKMNFVSTLKHWPVTGTDHTANDQMVLDSVWWNMPIVLRCYDLVYSLEDITPRKKSPGVSNREPSCALNENNEHQKRRRVTASLHSPCLLGQQLHGASEEGRCGVPPLNYVPTYDSPLLYHKKMWNDYPGSLKRRKKLDSRSWIPSPNNST